jgi:hypothetical protein
MSASLTDRSINAKLLLQLRDLFDGNPAQLGPDYKKILHGLFLGVQRLRRWVEEEGTKPHYLVT